MGFSEKLIKVTPSTPLPRHWMVETAPGEPITGNKAIPPRFGVFILSGKRIPMLAIRCWHMLWGEDIFQGDRAEGITVDGWNTTGISRRAAPVVVCDQRISGDLDMVDLAFL